MSPIIALKPGRFLDSSGTRREFTAADLKATAEAYSPELHEAPVVIGHPKHDSPAYGWIKRIRFDGGELKLEPDQVNPDFAEMRRSGAFKKHSIALYAPSDPRNPKPGVWYPRHIGFLGAKPPAIKGLPEAQFADGDSPVEIEFNELDTAGLVESLKSMFRGIRDLMLEQFGKEAADNALPDFEIESIDRLVREPTSDVPFAEDDGGKGTAGENTGGRARRRIRALRDAGMSTEDISDALDDMPGDVERSASTLQAIASGEIANPPESLVEALEAIEPPEDTEMSEADMTKQQLEERERRIKAREDAIAEAEAQRQRADAVEFAEQLAEKGRILPRQQPGLVEVLLSLPDEQIEFAEGEQTRNASPAKLFREFLESLPEAIRFGEQSFGDVPDVPVNIRVPAGCVADPERTEMYRKAKAYQAQHKCEFSEAVNAVSIAN